MDVFYLPSPAESYITVECATAKSNYNSSISYSRSPSPSRAEIVEDEIDRSNVTDEGGKVLRCSHFCHVKLNFRTTPSIKDAELLLFHRICFSFFFFISLFSRRTKSHLDAFRNKFRDSRATINDAMIYRRSGRHDNGDDAPLTG